MIRCHKNVFLTVIYMEKNREKFCPIFATSILQDIASSPLGPLPEIQDFTWQCGLTVVVNLKVFLTCCKYQRQADHVFKNQFSGKRKLGKSRQFSYRKYWSITILTARFSLMRQYSFTAAFIRERTKRLFLLSSEKDLKFLKTMKPIEKQNLLFNHRSARMKVLNVTRGLGSAFSTRFPSWKTFSRP